MPEELKASIIAEFKKLPLLPEYIDESRLEFQALLLEYAISTTATRDSKQSTRKQAAKELDIYQQALKDLTQAVEDLSPRALRAVNAAQELFRAKHRSKPRRISGPTVEDPPGFFGKPRTLLWRDLLPSNYEDLIRITEQATGELRSVSAEPEPGRHPNLAARSLSLALAEVFWTLTGQRPTRRTYTDTNPTNADGESMAGKAYGPFLKFVTACFSLAGLDASPETYVRFAVDNFAPPQTAKQQVRQ